MEVNWDKTLQMSICTGSVVHRPDGTELERKREIVYLGGLITSDGRVSRELSRRVGEGRSILNKLRQLWSHANLSYERKFVIFNACITSKVMYALESIWLLKVDRTRLDAFQCSCLRRILKIPPSFISRVRNAEVYERAGQIRYSILLENRQKKLFLKIQSLPFNNVVRKLVCDEEGYPLKWYIRRNRGRPQQRWAQSVGSLAL